ncbi:hypothetical protein GH741_10345 [Aquibacillus halophilus]|uniref:Uncharacterized protein n=1 Tax=Aquibacillus halophilus TaxID=930132 RepID=A0A6A8DC21_9BACI|nr:hypothetical protein [Aquibacillus halophilus]MRH43084.1 hypothetical protein [Aquibacillus halophilus]
MEDLFGMLLPLILIASWILGMFKKQDDSKKPENNRNPRPTPTTTGSATTETTDFEEPVQTGTQSYYENKRAQLEKFKNDNQINASNNKSNPILQEREIHDAIKSGKMPKVYKKTTGSGKKKKISLNNHLTKRGLAESVIMAEVLGSPRSLKPYRSVMQNKRY